MALTKLGVPERPAPVVEPPAPAGSRPLKVVMVIPYDLQRQPFTIRTIRFAEELRKRGHTVTLFHHDKEKWFRVRQPVLLHRFPKGVTIETINGIEGPTLGTWKKLGSAIRDADVVHFQKSQVRVLIPVLTLARRHDKPLYQDWDDYESWFWAQALRDAVGKESPKRLAGLSLRMALSFAAEAIIPQVVDTIGTSTNELRNRSVQFGADPGAVFPARVGVDVDVFSPARRSEELRRELGLGDHPTVLFAGSIDLEKDLHFLLDALAVMKKKAPESRCLIVGGGFGRARLEKLLKERGLEEMVVMTKTMIPFQQMPTYVASTDIAALPFSDTRVNRAKSSLTLLECMASGLAIVTNNVGEAGWMVGDGGVIAPHDVPGAATQFGEILADLANDAARRAKLGAAARERAAQSFGWHHSVDYLEKAYRAAIERHGSRGRPPSP